MYEVWIHRYWEEPYEERKFSDLGEARTFARRLQNSYLRANKKHFVRIIRTEEFGF